MIWVLFDDILAHLFLGDCYRSQGKVEKAIDQYNKLIKSQKKHVDLAAIRKAGILIDTKMYEEARHMLLDLNSKGI